MRIRQRLELALIAVVVGVNGVFTIACVLPGCGNIDVPDAPDSLVASVEDPYVPGDTARDTATVTTADTGATSTDGPLECSVDAPPSLSFGDVPEEVLFRYGGKEDSCAGPVGTGRAFNLAVAGLAPGPVDLEWSVEVGGRNPEQVDGTETRSPSCGTAGESLGFISVDLPKSADGEEVTLTAVATDTEGTEVSATATFVARIESY